MPDNEQTKTITIDLTSEVLMPAAIALLEQVHKSQLLLTKILTLQEKIQDGVLTLNGEPLDHDTVSLILEGLDLKYAEEETRIDRINEGLKPPTEEERKN